MGARFMVRPFPRKPLKSSRENEMSGLFLLLTQFSVQYSLGVFFFGNRVDEPSLAQFYSA